MRTSWIIKIWLVMLMATNVSANGEDIDTEYRVPPNSKLYDQEDAASSASSSGGGGATQAAAASGDFGRASDIPKTQAAIQKLEAAEKSWVSPIANNARNSVNSCKNAASRARMACLAQLSEHMQAGAAMIGVLVSGMGALSTSQACKKHNDTMKKVQVVLTLYNAACSGFQIACGNTCNGSAAQIKAATAKATAQLANPFIGPQAEADLEALKVMSGAVQEQIAICEGYKWNLAAAAAGLLNTVKQANISKSCVDATTTNNAGTGGGDGSSEGGSVTMNTGAESVDCSMEKHSKKPECICQQTPNAPGCPGFQGISSLAGPSGGAAPKGATPSSSATPSLSSLTSSTNGGDGFVSPTGGSRSAGMGGGGSGGGGGGGGSGGGGKSAGGADATKKAGAGINTNIISGYDGGGGGGGRGAGSFGRYDPASSKYKAYLPGGAKDPTRGLASQTFGNGQVTGAGSKSNWEKVSDRYKDNKSTLMGN